MKLLDGENCEGLTDLKWYLLDGALKLTLPKESHDLDRDSQHLSEEFEKAATYGGNENGSCIRIFKRRVEEKTMTTFMPAPPATTFLEDSYIQIYNVRVNEVKTKIKGHHKRITGIALSNSLNVLISAGADSQVIVKYVAFVNCLTKRIMTSYLELSLSYVLFSRSIGPLKLYITEMDMHVRGNKKMVNYRASEILDGLVHTRFVKSNIFFKNPIWVNHLNRRIRATKLGGRT